MAPIQPQPRAEGTANPNDPTLRPGPDTTTQAGADQLPPCRAGQPCAGDLRFEISDLRTANEPNMRVVTNPRATEGAAEGLTQLASPTTALAEGARSAGATTHLLPSGAATAAVRLAVDGGRARGAQGCVPRGTRNQQCHHVALSGNSRISRAKQHVSLRGTRQVSCCGTTIREGLEMAHLRFEMEGVDPARRIPERPTPHRRSRMATAARSARRAMGKAVGAAIAALAVTGCKSPDQTAAVLTTLERGRARGQLTVTTDGRLGLGQATTFWAGASGSTVAFSGDIDFSEGAQPTSSATPVWGQSPAGPAAATETTP